MLVTKIYNDKYYFDRIDFSVYEQADKGMIKVASIFRNDNNKLSARVFERCPAGLIKEALEKANQLIAIKEMRGYVALEKRG